MDLHDAHMVTKVGEDLCSGPPDPNPARGARPNNQHFAVSPDARRSSLLRDYDHLTVVGHSMGGGHPIYLAKQYPDVRQEGRDARQLALPFITGGIVQEFSRSALKTPAVQHEPIPAYSERGWSVRRRAYGGQNPKDYAGPAHNDMATRVGKRPRRRSRAAGTGSSTHRPNSTYAPVE